MPPEQDRPKRFHLYLDDSGTRHPTRNPGKKPAHGYDWFAMGGVLIDESKEEEARALHADFAAKWAIESPLHSSEIRSQNERFLWLREKSSAERDQFYEELYCLMRDAPVVGIACVVDRPGYNKRYEDQYRENRWMLCKTAFCVVVERAAKFARSNGAKLRVLPEKCNKEEDQALKSYYEELRANGPPFNNDRSGKYNPMSQAEFADTLYELRFKAKTSPLAQLADLFLWPISMGGYHAGNRPYRRLLEDGKLIECLLAPETHSMLGSKYSCFELVDRKE